MTDQNIFHIPFGEAELVGDTFPAGETPEILVLHGAGQSTRTRYTPTRERLADAGHASVAFDHVGHGDTSGELTGSSLKQRTDEAEAIVRFTKIPEPFAALGGSMGGYTALKLTETHSISTLVLCVPGVYTTQAYDVPFGESFSAILHKKRSWEQTDAWDIIGKFTGKLLIVAAENDAVVPLEIHRRLYDSAMNAKSRELYIVPGSPHKIMPYFDENPAEFDAFIQKVQRVLEKE